MPSEHSMVGSRRATQTERASDLCAPLGRTERHQWLGQGPFEPIFRLE